MKPPVTLNQIAQRVGVSPQTVANALGNRVPRNYGRAAARAERIRIIAKELGYRPNSAARAVAKGRFQRVGLVLPHGRSSYIPHEFMGGLTHALAESHHQLAACELPPADSGDELPHMLRDLSVDGTINLLDTPPQDTQRMLAELSLPMVWVNVKMPGNCVYPDEIDGARRLTAHLLAQGHRRIVYLDHARHWVWEQEPAPDLDPGGPLEARRSVSVPLEAPRGEHYSRDDRRAGYALAMQEAGLAPMFHDLRVRSFAEEINDIRALLHKDRRPDALVIPNEVSVSKVVRAAMAERIAVPDELPLATFSWGSEISATYGAATMVYGGPRLASVAVDTLEQQIKDHTSQAPARTIPGRLVIN